MSLRVFDLAKATPVAQPSRPANPRGLLRTQNGLRCRDTALGAFAYEQIQVLSVFTRTPDEGSATYLLLHVDGLAQPLAVAMQHLDFEAIGVPKDDDIFARLRLFVRYLIQQVGEVVLDQGTY
ncbi:MAG: hypothetical protein AAGD38_24920, partial [Acidobacteriota bacterium]